jgi:hypothetical protein
MRRPSSRITLNARQDIRLRQVSPQEIRTVPPGPRWGVPPGASVRNRALCRSATHSFSFAMLPERPINVLPFRSLPTGRELCNCYAYSTIKAPDKGEVGGSCPRKPAVTAGLRMLYQESRPIMQPTLHRPYWLGFTPSFRVQLGSKIPQTALPSCAAIRLPSSRSETRWQHFPRRPFREVSTRS